MLKHISTVRYTRQARFQNKKQEPTQYKNPNIFTRACDSAFHTIK